MHLGASLWHSVQAEPTALAAKETERAEAAAQLERRMAAMEAVLAARRTPVAEAKPEAARGPGADLRFQVSASWHTLYAISAADGCAALHYHLGCKAISLGAPAPTTATGLLLRTGRFVDIDLL